METIIKFSIIYQNILTSGRVPHPGPPEICSRRGKDTVVNFGAKLAAGNRDRLLDESLPVFVSIVKIWLLCLQQLTAF